MCPQLRLRRTLLPQRQRLGPLSILQLHWQGSLQKQPSQLQLIHQQPMSYQLPLRSAQRPLPPPVQDFQILGLPARREPLQWPWTPA